MALAEAITTRIVDENGPSLRWRITIGDAEMSETDMTVGECAQVEAITGRTWHTLTPGESAEITRAFAVVTLLRTVPTHKEALEKVSNMTVHDLTACVTRDQGPDPTEPAGS